MENPEPVVLQEQFQPPEEIPWGAREAWFGIAFLGIWIGLSAAISFLLANAQQEVLAGPTMLLLELALLIPVWWFVFRRHGAGWKELGFRRFTWKDLGIGCGLLVGMYVFMLVYGIVLSVFNIEPDVNWVEIFESQASPGWLIFTVVVAAPFLEEILFRGFIFTGFRNKYGWFTAMLISGVLFAVNHLQLVGLITYFLLGCILAYLRHSSKSLWPPIFFHMIINGVSTGLVYLVSSLTSM